MGRALTVGIFFTTIMAVFAGAAHSKLIVLSGQALGSSRELLPSAHSAQLVSLGFDRLAADYFWLRFVSYIGDVRARQLDRYALADRYIDLITDLDPGFVQAYWFAAFVIGGDQRNPTRAAELIDYGVKQNPDNWYLPFIAGINQLLYRNDATAAVKYYRIASNYPGAPSWLARQAEILKVEEPRLVKEANIWFNVFKSTDDRLVKTRSLERCVWLWVQVYKTAPNHAYRDRAREVLKELGVDVASLKKPE